MSLTNILTESDSSLQLLPVYTYLWSCATHILCTPPILTRGKPSQCQDNRGRTRGRCTWMWTGLDGMHRRAVVLAAWAAHPPGCPGRAAECLALLNRSPGQCRPAAVSQTGIEPAREGSTSPGWWATWSRMSCSCWTGSSRRWTPGGTRPRRVTTLGSPVHPPWWQWYRPRPSGYGQPGLDWPSRKNGQTVAQEVNK